MKRGKTSNTHIADPCDLVEQLGEPSRTFVPALLRMDSRALSRPSDISSFSALAWGLSARGPRVGPQDASQSGERRWGFFHPQYSWARACSPKDLKAISRCGEMTRDHRHTPVRSSMSRRSCACFRSPRASELYRCSIWSSQVTRCGNLELLSGKEGEGPVIGRRKSAHSLGRGEPLVPVNRPSKPTSRGRDRSAVYYPDFESCVYGTPTEPLVKPLVGF